MKSFKQYIAEIGVDPFKIAGKPAWTESLSTLLFDIKTDGINFLNYSRQMFADIELPVTSFTTFSTSYDSSEFTANAFRLPVVTGDLVLFPSSLRHSVNLNQTTDQRRISLSFNTFVFGELGYYDEANHLILK